MVSQLLRKLTISTSSTRQRFGSPKEREGRWAVTYTSDFLNEKSRMRVDSCMHRLRMCLREEGVYAAFLSR